MFLTVPFLFHLLLCFHERLFLLRAYFRVGQADRADGWSYRYRDSYAYQDATYGYTGYYVNPDEYRYYFRAGFRRGYEDGYYSRLQYGRYEEGKYAILAAVLAQILNLQPLY